MTEPERQDRDEDSKKSSWWWLFWPWTALYDKNGGPHEPKKPRKQRPHPYADEPSSEGEDRIDPRIVTFVWLGVSILMAWGGWMLATRNGYINNQFAQNPDWDTWNGAILATSLVFLGLGLWQKVPLRRAHQARLIGWVLFAAFWALTARDLYVREESDLVNSSAAVLFGVFGVNYFAYHEWLNIKRDVRSVATRFLAVTAFVAAGTYFVIAKIAPARIWMIQVVGGHTKWMLDRFGFGSDMGLQFHIDKFDPWGPVLFHYPDTYCATQRADPIGEWCAAHRDAWTPTYANGTAYPEGNQVFTYPESDGWLDDIFQYAPAGEDLRIIPVSIILACTAIQTIALFVGLFMGTQATWKQRILWASGVGALIYVLNLLRNTLVIWAYGRGHMSFYMVHNVLAKVLTLGALIGIVLYAFKRFPAFLDALGSLLDLIHRDGPIERTLKIGRRRPPGPSIPAIE